MRTKNRYKAQNYSHQARTSIDSEGTKSTQVVLSVGDEGGEQ